MAADANTLASSTSPNTVQDRLRSAFARLNAQQKMLFMITIAVIIALITVSVLWSKQPDYRVLFSNISDRDGGAIIPVLVQLNVPYKFSDSGGAILIPANKVNEIRLRLASQGLPKGGNVGFELMESQKFGISQFAEQVNYQRGLEGELSRTIQSISAIQTARVHLAIPKPTVFVREELKPSASILLNLYPGRALEAAQIAGIQNLVAASVPNLAVGNVTLIDQSGAMLSQLKSKLLEAGLDPTQIKYIQETEASIIKRIDDILVPIVGLGNARVQVAADLDFSQSEQTAETHRPNNKPTESSIRSQQTSESASATPSSIGIPGALSNQPPVPATAPLTQPAVPGAGAPPVAVGAPLPGQLNAAGVQAPIASVAQPLNTRKDLTTNYEVDKTIQHIKNSVGTIKRLSAAVVINHRKDETGKSPTKPLSEPEIQQINELVKEAMGFSKERGDSISVVNASFSLVEPTVFELPAWKNPEIIALGSELLKYALIMAVILYLLLGVVRPLVKTMFPPPPTEAALSAAAGGVVLGENGEVVEVEAPISGAASLEKKLEMARELAQKDPKVVANIIKEWMGSNAS